MEPCSRHLSLLHFPEMALENGNPVAAGAEQSAFWKWKVRRVQWRVNVGWWLEKMLPMAFGACVLMTALIFAGRRNGWSAEALGIAGGVVVLLLVAFSLWAARSHFISFPTAQAKLEDMLALHNRLSAAAAGVGAWPAREEWRSGRWPWNWRRLGVLPAAGLCLLIAALLIPISPYKSAAVAPTAKPPALESVEEWLAELEKTDALDPESLEPVKEQAEELAKQDPEDWYSHASLEAADHLRAKMQAGMQSVAEQAGKMEQMLGEQEGAPTEEEAKEFAEQMKGALSALEGNLPSLNQELAKQLRNLNLSKLSPEQLQKLRERLKEAKGLCENCLGGCLPGEGEGEPKEGPGRGGVQRGPGTAPLAFEQDQTNLGTKKTEALESDDFRDAALGDQVGMSTGVPEVDPTVQVRVESGGAIRNAGAGADAVWLQQNVSPEERRRLRSFFQ